MTNCVTLKNLEICKNTILYLLAIQIPGNSKILNYKSKITKGTSPASTNFYQIVSPNLIMNNQKFTKLNIIDAADTFVKGYIAKMTDIYIMNNYTKFIAKKSQVPSMYRSVLNNFYFLSGSELLYYITLDNEQFIGNDYADTGIQRFGLGSFAALYDYENFEKNNLSLPNFLNLYLTKNKDLIIQILEDKLIDHINKKEIYKNDLYITTLAEIFYFSNTA
jgi:hypothetical protein